MKLWLPGLELETPESTLPSTAAIVKKLEKTLESDCGFSWSWGQYCLLPRIGATEGWIQNTAAAPFAEFGAAMAVGLLDGLLGSIESIYDTGTGIFKRAASIGKYGLELTDTAIRRGALAAVFKLGGDAYGQARALQQNIRQLRTNLKGWIDDGGAKMRRIIEEMARGLRDWLGGLLDLEKDRGYEVGVLLFDVVLAAFSGGTTLGSKFLPQLYRWLERLEHQANGFIWEVLGYAESKADEIPGLRGKISRCKILGKGCFVAGTPVLMAGNTIGQSGKIYALAVDMPVAVMPIDDVPLLSYALANKTVNSSYSMTASSDDVYIGLISGDPYTSQEQKHRDLYEINHTDWQAVSFQGMYSSSACHLAMHSDWIAQHGYVVDGIVNLNLPEQGITGPFRITSIKHILPQKKPETDPDDGYEWKPVTGLFIHQSDQVHNVSFDNNATLGVTARHPVFSTTYNDWRPAGELEVGEMVLTYQGEVVVTSATKKEEEATVYNLEVKDLHNFLVGQSGIVVHNNCWDEADKVVNGTISKAEIWAMKVFPDIFNRGGIVEKIVRKGTYTSGKGWRYTGVGDGGLGKTNYWLVDFFKGNRVVSLKSTTVKNGSNWATSNADHIRDLNQQLKLRKFPNCKPGPNCINPSYVIDDITEAELHIVVEKLSDINKSEWITAIKSKLPVGEQNNLIITITEL